MDATDVVTFDLDFYVFAAWQLREVGRQAMARLSLADVAPILEGLDAAIPRLREYRNVMAHAVDDGLENVAWFGPFAAELQPEGRVEYIVDARTHHESLERFFEELIDVIEPHSSGAAKEPNDRARRSSA